MSLSVGEMTANKKDTHQQEKLRSEPDVFEKNQCINEICLAMERTHVAKQGRRSCREFARRNGQGFKLNRLIPHFPGVRNFISLNTTHHKYIETQSQASFKVEPRCGGAHGVNTNKV